MPNYPEHWLLSFGGTMCAGNEIWASNIRMAKTGDPGGVLTVEDEMLDACVTKINDHIAGSGARWRAGVKCTWVKFNRINSAGHYADAGKTNARYLTGGAIIDGGGTAGAAPLPPQTCLVITFRTAQARGRASRGRLFQPVPGVEVDPNGHVAGGTNITQGIANAWKTFLQSLGNWPGLDLTDMAPAVVSGISPVWHHITAVEVGDVLDTQRRRRNNLTEVRATATL